LLVVVVAALSDVADGALSRGLHATSSFGRTVDPVADKVFVLGVLFPLIAEGTLSLERALLIGLRDWTVLAGAGWLWLWRGVGTLPSIAPTLLGKATTAAQFLYLIGLLVAGPSMTALFVVTVALSALAALDYAVRFFRLPRMSGRGI
jgi:phosphatidylglycerophosphate synthase